ncbi:Opacity protein [Bosea sp. OK403]|uniref:outer membrane protein n=1 Tax=Bosea sp. OK403 TaxID=1855286 RepID=UPI0008E3A6B8|nr:outer membrane beta-barrel protein [Bosea sp. OK403]SFJ55548.1 Opacity protein [Bosea sp. OK403]
MRIRSLILTGVAAAGFVLVVDRAASAADYPVLRGSQQTEDAPPRDFDSGTFNWSGFYFGGGAGVSDTNFKPGNGLQDLARYAYRNTNLGAENDMGSFVSNLPEKRDSGATFFGFTGYNFAFGDAILGLEADYTRSGHSYSESDFIARQTTTSDGTINNWSMTTNQGAKLHDYATARLRMGWAYGRIMPFATIGGAVGRFDTTSTIDATWRFTRTNAVTGAIENNVVASGYPLRVGATKNNVYGFGLTIGGGIDMALTENLFVRAEYQLIRFADVEGTTTTINTARVAAGLKF